MTSLPRPFLIAATAVFLAGCSFSGEVSSTTPSSQESGDASSAAGATSTTATSAAPTSPAGPTTTTIASPVSGGSTLAPGGLTKIRFGAGETSTVVTGTAGAGQRRQFRFDAAEGQELTMAITSDRDQVNFGLVAPDGTPLKRVAGESREFETTLPITGSYEVEIASEQGGVDFSLTVTIV